MPSNTEVFVVRFNYTEKADLGKGSLNPKRKLKVTMPMSELIEQKHSQKDPQIDVQLYLKSAWIPRVLFFPFQTALAQIFFSRINSTDIPLYQWLRFSYG